MLYEERLVVQRYFDTLRTLAQAEDALNRQQEPVFSTASALENFQAVEERFISFGYRTLLPRCGHLPLTSEHVVKCVPGESANRHARVFVRNLKKRIEEVLRAG